MFDKLKSWLNKLYAELTTVQESPHRVALSFSIGIFLGILPFTGILAAIFIAIYFKLNKAAAILGSAITNTWLGIIVLGLAVQLGAAISGADWQALQGQVDNVIKNFSWKTLQQVDILPLLGSVALGYMLISLGFAIIGYGVARAVLYWQRRG